MKKLGDETYNRLLAQAEEAKEQGKHKLANCILYAIGSVSETTEEYSYKDLQEDIRQDAWRLATNILSYHNVKSVDAEKLDEAITATAEMLTIELETALGIKPGTIGPLEPKLPGENK